MKVGDASEVTKVFNAVDVLDYTGLSQHSVTAGRVPGPLIGALFSYLLGVRLPGPGTMYLKQETQFHDQASAGDELTARVEITRIRPEKHLVDLSTTCSAAGGRLVANGRALVYVRDVAGSADRRD